MKKIKFSLNHKTKNIHVVLKYKDLIFLNKFFPLLDINSTMMVIENYNGDIVVTEYTENDFLNTIGNYKLDSKVISLLFLDGCIVDFKNGDEIKYLTGDLIRFFIMVDYIENEIHILINTKKYENILKKIKSLN